MAQRVAFLIGNQSFLPDSGFHPLEGPANDLAALAPLLRDPERGGFAVREFLDKNRNEVLLDLEQALGSAALGDLILIYYSGHGKLTRYGGQLCLATADSRENALRSTSIPARDLREMVEESNCDQIVLLLDCCYSGAVMRGGDVSSELRIVDDASGFYIMTASTSIQPARETAPLPGGTVMGRFTAALVDGLETGAADQGRKGKILLSDLRHHLERAVIGSTPQFFDLRATGDPLISLSPATALEARIWHLINMLEGPFDDERLRAIQQLEATGTTERRAISALIKAAGANNDVAIRKASFSALGQIGPNAAEAVPVLAAALEDSDRIVRQSAPSALGKIGPAAVPVLMSALKNGDEIVRLRAADALGEIAPDAAEAVPALDAALKDSDEFVRWHAAIALGKIGPTAVPVLITALENTDRDIRWHAADALGEIGPDAAEAVPALDAALEDPDEIVRTHAAIALGKIGPTAVPALITAFKDRSGLVQQTVADALGKIGAAAVPALAAVLEDPDATVRRQVVEVLGKMGPAAAPALAVALKNPYKDVQSEAAYLLDRLGRNAAEATPILAAVLEDHPDATVRSYAADVLRNIGPAAAPALTSALKDRDGMVRLRAADALGMIGCGAVEAVPALAAALEDPDEIVRSHTARALGKIGTAAVPALLTALKNPDSDVRWHAAEALGMIGSDAAETVPNLAAALEDPDEKVRQSAAEALGNMGPRRRARLW